MTRTVFALALALAPSCTAGTPDSSAHAAELRHLLARVGLGATADELAALAPLTYEQAVDRLLATARTEPVTAPPPGMERSWSTRRGLRRSSGLSDEARRALREQLREEALGLKAWWLEEMLVTPSPLTERMTLLWHGHFTSSLREVRWAPALYRQNLTLRRHALGDFGELLRAVARDPAMMRYLDTANSRKERPNENFARELMELFTLGEGHYTERDVNEAARAFTGWTLDPRDGRFRFALRRHDGGEKTVLGRTGRLDGDDVIDVLLAQPRTAVHVTERLWSELVGEVRPEDRSAVDRLAASFREGSYEIRPLVRGILLSKAFRDPARRGTMLKSPVDLVVGTLRSLGLKPADTRPLALATRRLGQDLFDPPNVKGWPGGESWISATTLLDRRALLERVLIPLEAARPGAARRPGRPSGGKRARAASLAMFGRPPALPRWLIPAPATTGPTRGDDEGEASNRPSPRRLLLAVPPADPIPEDASGIELLRALLLDPAYQVK